MGPRISLTIVVGLAWLVFPQQVGTALAQQDADAAIDAVDDTEMVADEVNTEPAEFTSVVTSSVVFEDVEVPGWDPGLKMAVIHGDPSASAGDFTVRLAFPAGYRFPPHWHPQAEHSIVLKGVLLLAMGAVADDSVLIEYRPGDFLYIPATKPHFGGAVEETVIQVWGQAPFEIYPVETSE